MSLHEFQLASSCSSSFSVIRTSAHLLFFIFFLSGLMACFQMGNYPFVVGDSSIAVIFVVGFLGTAPVFFTFWGYILMLVQCSVAFGECCFLEHERFASICSITVLLFGWAVLHC